MYELPITVSLLLGVVLPIPKLVPSNTKLAESVKAVPPLLVKSSRLAVKEDGVSVNPKKVPLPSPRVEVATHCVEVPVVFKTIPRVPVAVVESFRAPVRVSPPLR